MTRPGRPAESAPVIKKKIDSVAKSSWPLDKGSWSGGF